MAKGRSAAAKAAKKNSTTPGAGGGDATGKPSAGAAGAADADKDMNASDPGATAAAAKASRKKSGAYKVGDDVLYTPEPQDRRDYEPALGANPAAVPAKIVADYGDGKVALQVFGVNRTYPKVATCNGSEGKAGCWHTA